MAHGGRRPGSGRKAGAKPKRAAVTPKLAATGIKVAAMRYSDMALKNVVELAECKENPAVRLGACKEILDRAYGKPSQETKVTGDGNPVELVHRIILVAGKGRVVEGDAERGIPRKIIDVDVDA